VNLLFDLDGTLTDPAVGITTCLQHALRALDRPVPAAETLCRFVGPPIRETFAELLATRDEALIAGAVRLYRGRFAPIGMFENEVYPEVPPALETLNGRGHRMWVVTAKPVVYATAVLEHFALRSYFEGVHGPELAEVDRDKADLVREVLERERLVKGSTLMIGDRIHDIRAARKNGLAVVGVRWGYGTDEELRDGAPDAIVASVPELLAFIDARERR
jgi:phosphoglycolate phosphatase